MSSLLSSIPYILVILTVLLALFQLIKEWDEYKDRKLRRGVLTTLILVGILTLISLRLDKKGKDEEKRESEASIRELKSKAQTANDAQRDNTKLFLDSLHSVSKEVADLKTQVRTEELQKKLESVQADLQKTQTALAPGPKAELTFSFVPFDNPPPGTTPAGPSTNTTLPLNSDGSMHIEFTILNTTQVDATNAELSIQICDHCKYAKEPSDLLRLPGMSARVRYLFLSHLQPMQAYQTISVDVIPPPLPIKAFPIGFEYRCLTCIYRKDATTGIVHILGR